MRVDNNDGDPSLEPLIDPTSAAEYDDDYEEENEGEAEYGEDDASTPPRQTPPSGCAGSSPISPRTLSMTRRASRWRPANAAAVSSSACAFRRRNWARSSVAAAVSPEPCARRS